MFDLSQFNDYREDNRREVKKAMGGLPDSLWSTYSAFANCYGGVIILGAKENDDGSYYGDLCSGGQEGTEADISWKRYV